MRFSGWAIWALPLVLAFREPGIIDKERSGESIEEVRRMASNLGPPADGVAWRTQAHPRYLLRFGVVLLVLDVNSPDDRRRADAIFSIVDWLVTEKGSAVFEFAEDLKKCWNEASPAVSPAAQEPVWAGKIAELLASVADYLPDEIAYKESGWNASGKDLMDLLKVEATEEEWIKELNKFAWKPETDIRHVFHAGCRRAGSWPTKLSTRWTGGKANQAATKALKQRTILRRHQKREAY